MSTFWLSLTNLLWYHIYINVASEDCTYLQGELDTRSETYLVAYVPYVCMSFGRTHLTDKNGYHTHIDTSAMFSCQANGELRYDEYKDEECEDRHQDRAETNLNTGDTVKIDDDTVTIRDFRCDNTSRSATCEFLSNRVSTSCSGDGPLYDEVFIVDECLPTLSGEYQIISCSWHEAIRTTYDDEDCTENGQSEIYLHNDYNLDDCSSDDNTCRGYSDNCRTNFTLCSTGGSNPFRQCDDYYWPVAQQFFCQSAAMRCHWCGHYGGLLVLVLMVFMYD
eukprot:699202_1